MKKIPRRTPEPVRIIDNFWNKPEIVAEVEKNLNKLKNLTKPTT